VSSADFAIRNVRQSRAGPSDDRPLTEQEFQLIQRLLSDPFSFPLQFKSWLVSYLETSDMNLPMSAVSGLQKTLGISGAGQGTLGIFPAGLILPYGGDIAPEGSLLCDGGVYSTTLQKRLFDAIGYKYGGSGASFNVPDIRERIPVGKGSIAAHDTVGKTENQPLGQRGAQHNHTVNDPGHYLTLHGDSGTNTGNRSRAADFGDGSGWSGSEVNQPAPQYPQTTGISVGPGGGHPNDGPAFITLNFIIVN
jgi:microcystin-dependent protein